MADLLKLGILQRFGNGSACLTHVQNVALRFRSLGTAIDCSCTELRKSVPGNHHRCAGASKLRQIAVGRHSDLQAWPLPANNWTIIVRLQQCTSQASPSSTSSMARVPKLAGLAELGKCSCLLEGCGAQNVGRDQIRKRLARSGPINAGLCGGSRCHSNGANATSSF